MSADRVSTGIRELDRVLGGGFLPASMILLAGSPGSGKTILATQLFGEANKSVICSILEKKHEIRREKIPERLEEESKVHQFRTFAGTFAKQCFAYGDRLDHHRCLIDGRRQAYSGSNNISIQLDEFFHI